MNSSNPILVERYRGDVLESFHRGVVCVLDRDFKVLFSLGDVDQITYPRSSLKLFQHLPLLESGAVEKYGISLDEIAVMCGSHNAEEVHVKAVSSILARIGLDKSCLACGAQDPNLRSDRLVMYREGLRPEDIHNNCSGKHAGFLTLANFIGANISSYLDPEHPVQVKVRKVIAEMHEVKEEQMQTGIDGCSAPVYSMPLKNLAIGAVNLINPQKFGTQRTKACNKMIEAITSHPHMVAGSKRYCTEMMQVYEGKVFGKTGAEGVFVLGLPERKIGVAIKIDDGRSGAQYRVAQEIIKRLIPEQTGAEQLARYSSEPILNWKKIETGFERVCGELFEGLDGL